MFQNNSKRGKVIKWTFSILLIITIIISISFFLNDQYHRAAIINAPNYSAVSKEKKKVTKVIYDNKKKAVFQKENKKLKKNISKSIKNGERYFLDPKTKVFLKINNSSIDNFQKQKQDLNKGLITFAQYNDLQGNFVIFGHNSYWGNYLTLEVKSLKAKSKVFIFEKKQNQIYQYTYVINKKRILNTKDTAKIFYKSSNKLINIGTCASWKQTDQRIVWTGVQNKVQKIKKIQI